MNLGSDDVPTLREVVLALYHHAGTRPRLIDVGTGVARIAVKGLSALKLSPLEPQHLEIALRDHLFDNRLASSYANLMKLFYQGMLKDGLRPAAALRAAQIAMWKAEPNAIPYRWGAFILQGDWN